MSRLRKILRENGQILGPAVFTFLLIYLSAFTGGYGYFIDEFYYISCAAQPAFGYVDHPPLAPFLLTLFGFFFGTSLYAIRILPALAQASSVFLTGVVARDMGGGRTAQLLAASSMATAPMFISMGGFYSMNAFEPLLAVILIRQAVLMVRRNDHRNWIRIGIVAGLGIMNKHTFALFVAALAVSFLISREWRMIINRWFFAGMAALFLICLPNLWWQAANDFPSLEFYRNISLNKNVHTPPADFIMGQVAGMSPSTVPVWLAGIFFLLFSGKSREFRFLPILFLLLFLFMMLTGTSRSDRMIFAYPAVFTGGAIFFERYFEKIRARWLSLVLILFLLAGLALALPLILPYFDYRTVESHVKRLGFNTEIEKGKKPPLPQILADRIGWEEKYELVRRAYQSLTDDERRRTIVAAGNYGDAGMIELFGKKDSIAPVCSGHNNFYLWSKERIRGDILLQLEQRDSYDGMKKLFGTVENFGGEFSSPFVSSHENHLRVFICRDPKISFLEMLESGKIYN